MKLTAYTSLYGNYDTSLRSGTLRSGTLRSGTFACNRLTEWESERVTEWQSDRLTEWQSDRVTEWQSDRVTEWQTDRLTDWQTDRVTEWQSDRLTEWQSGNKQALSHLHLHSYSACSGSGSLHFRSQWKRRWNFSLFQCWVCHSDCRPVTVRRVRVWPACTCWHVIPEYLVLVVQQGYAAMLFGTWLLGMCLGTVNAPFNI